MALQSRVDFFRDLATYPLRLKMAIGESSFNRDPAGSLGRYSRWRG